MPTVAVTIPDNKLEHVFAVAFAPVVALSELIKNASDSCHTKDDTIKVFVEENEKRIRIVDNGYGFSAQDIKELGSATKSSKMSETNKVSRIGEYYAGSKGQGIFTAFNLCSSLKIRTFSHADKKSYSLNWEIGTAKISYYESDKVFDKTEIILNDISDDIFKMIKGYDEPQKLISSTILYYEDKKHYLKLIFILMVNWSDPTPKRK